MAYRDQIATTVDQLIKEGSVPEGMREQYINLMAADDKTAEKFAGMLMRGADYTRKTQELAEQRRQQDAAYQAKLAEADARRAALEKWEADAQAELQRYKDIAERYPSDQAALAAYKQKLADYNLLDETAVPAVAPTQPAQPKEIPVSQTQLPADYLKRDDAASAIRDLMIMQGQLQAIAGEHYKLYGQPLTDNLMQEAMNAGVQDIRQFWESKYNVQGKRAEVQQAAYNAELERVRTEERNKVMAELAADPSRVTGGQPFAGQQHSQLFDTYASRAVAAAVDGTVKPLSELAPELRPTTVATQNRVDRAMQNYAQNFNPDGSPRLGGGPAQ